MGDTVDTKRKKIDSIRTNDEHMRLNGITCLALEIIPNDLNTAEVSHTPQEIIKKLYWDSSAYFMVFKI